MAKTTATKPGRRRSDSLVAAPVRRSTWLDDHLGQWRQQGIVTDEQCAAIRTFEHLDDQPAAPPPTLSLANEVVVYLGSTLAIAGGAVVVARSWESLGYAARLSIGALIAAVGFLAGAALARRHEETTSRLASFLWVIATGGIVLCASVTSDAWGWSGEGVALAIGAPVLVIGLVTWRNLARPLQLLTAVAGLTITVGALASLTEIEMWLVGFAVMAVSILFVAASLRGRVEPRETAIFVGSFGAIVGAVMLRELDVHLGGIAPAIISAGVVTLALATGRTLLVVLGVLTFFQSLNAALSTTFNRPVAAVILTLVGLLAVTAVVARSLHGPGADSDDAGDPHDDGTERIRSTAPHPTA